ncbi:NAD(P)-dependent oxidoreductase [Nocardioides sp. AX2bis]|uniref:NAD(P)-dependent oxidoreductase n=1 Tax=Nocardioides sp. AX2bis TaxID=2653157 RepID=UPI0012F078D2|nr:NAD(P)-dependent oxidoreductase [Nocardioides sp. AX2bis]VXC50524.1 3-hydroxyisobutyrate dehydrogenase [Nocardioides sp. AX2bis]
MTEQALPTTPARTPVVAFLGTGTMGAPMARNVAGAGLETRVWNRTTSRAEPLADVATVCASVAEAVAGADVVVTMLYDAESVATTMEEARGSLSPDAVWVQQSTVGVDGSDRLAALADDLGVAYLDAPVLGTKEPAEKGALVVLASGPEELRERVAPVLDAVGSRTTWVGPVGAGSRLKLAANAWVLSVVQGVADSLTLARELGVDPRAFLEAVAGGALDAPYVQLKGTAMLDGAHDASFALAGGVKDAGLILDAARAAGVDLALVPGVHERMRAAEQAGYGDLDLSATYLLGLGGADRQQD